jgi:ornithine lipid ester-linked acyl 2-hydroxylase
MARRWHLSRFPAFCSLQKRLFPRLFQLAQRSIERWDGTAQREFLDPLPWAAALEAQWTAVRADADHVLANKDQVPNIEALSPEQKALSYGEGWKTFCLYLYGKKIESNCRVAPQTARLLARVPGLRTAIVSILSAGKRLPPHHGMYKGLLRYQLALKIPSESAADCALRVGRETRAWKEGEGFLFDDTFEHEAWNLTSEDRVVLILDIVRPLPAWLGWLNRLVVWSLCESDFMAEIHRLLESHNEKTAGHFAEPLPV